MDYLNQQSYSINKDRKPTNQTPNLYHKNSLTKTNQEIMISIKPPLSSLRNIYPYYLDNANDKFMRISKK